MATLNMSTSQQSQMGGALNNPLDVLLRHIDTVPHIIYGLLAIVVISYADQVYPSVSNLADTALGRLAGLAVVLVVHHCMGFSYGLLTALAFLLVLHASSRLSATGVGVDGFQDVRRYDTIGTRWFVERVLGEQPREIVTDTARTTAVQDLSEKSMGSKSR
jgi:hypothetical protein